MEKDLDYMLLLFKTESRNAAILKKLIKKKAKIDLGTANTATKKFELLFLIGEDHLFRKGEDEHKQSIRHYLHIFSESIREFLNRIDNLEKLAAELPNVNKFALGSDELTADKIVKFFLRIEEECSLFKSVHAQVLELLEVYAAEAKALEKKDWESYFKLIAEEKKYGEFMNSHAGEMYHLFIVLKNIERESEGDIAIGGVLMALCVIPFIWLVAIFGDSSSNELSMSVPAGITVLSLSVLANYHKMNLSRAGSKAWDRLHEFIFQKFVRKQMNIYSKT